MMNNHKKLKYLTNTSASHELEPPKKSGIPVIDFVNQLCFSMGLDPEIFKNWNQAQQYLNESSSGQH